MSNEQLMNDMSVHLSKQFRKVIIDIVGTCKIADVSASDIIKIIIAGILTELTMTAEAIELDQDEFLEMCRIAFVQSKPKKRRRR